jgi:hypothetical protein
MGPAFIAQTITDPIIMQTFGPIRGTRGLIVIGPAAGPTGTAIIADRVITTAHGIITTGRKFTMSMFFRRPGCFHRCRHFSGRITKQGCATFH